MNKLSGRLEAHFATCAAVALVGMGAATGTANAAVIQSPASVNVAIPVTFAGVYVNIVAGTTSTSSSLTGWDINPYGTSGLTWFSPATGGAVMGLGSSTTLVDNLALGTVVGAAQSFGTGVRQLETGGPTAFIFNSSNNYVGFSFQEASLGAGTFYGYVQLKLGASFTDPVRQIVGIWYENVAGADITVTPAPGAIALLGLAGLVGKRRRK